MSSSQYKAALQLSTSEVLYFSRLKSDQGGPQIIPELLEEEMRDGGADGSRFRDISLQFTDWIFTTSADATSYDGVLELKAQYERAQNRGLVATLRLELGGVFRVYKYLKIRRVEPRCRPGSSTGWGAESSSNGLIYATWTTKFMKLQDT